MAGAALVLSVSSCAGTEYAVLAYIANGAGGHDGTLSAPVALTIRPSNEFAVLPYLAEVPSMSTVKTRFRGQVATGKAWTCVARAENATSLTLSVGAFKFAERESLEDVKAGCDTGCTSGEVTVTNAADLEVTMTGCTLEVGAGSSVKLFFRVA